MTATPDSIMADGFDARVDQALLQRLMPLAPASRVAQLAGPISSAAFRHQINTPARLAALLATIAVETESLRYMAEIWGPTEQQRRYDPPSDLADMLGNKYAGDGKRFRGRGLIMITGRYNYEVMTSKLHLDVVAMPDLLEQPFWAAASAGIWWTLHDCNDAADHGGIEAVTKIVNGGLTAINKRRAVFNHALEVLR